MTLAPENDVENALTTYCHEHDVVISIGHTATYEQAMALSKQVQKFTHTFNGMEDISHRKPTAVVALWIVKKRLLKLLLMGYMLIIH